MILVGVGNPLRRDDGVGPWLAAALARRGCATAVAARDGAAVAALLDGKRAAAIVDATRGAGAPGTLTALDLWCGDLRDGLSPASTHLVGLTQGVALLRALGTLPRPLLFFGIEGADFGWGEGLTPAVEAAARALLPRLVQLQVAGAPVSGGG
jgi:hydrogenase maturation protease